MPLVCTFRRKTAEGHSSAQHSTDGCAHNGHHVQDIKEHDEEKTKK